MEAPKYVIDDLDNWGESSETEWNIHALLHDIVGMGNYFIGENDTISRKTAQWVYSQEDDLTREFAVIEHVFGSERMVRRYEWSRKATSNY